jgi:hypothetical protein
MYDAGTRDRGSIASPQNVRESVVIQIHDKYSGGSESVGIRTGLLNVSAETVNVAQTAAARKNNVAQWIFFILAYWAPGLTVKYSEVMFRQAYHLNSTERSSYALHQRLAARADVASRRMAPSLVSMHAV